MFLTPRVFVNTKKRPFVKANALSLIALSVATLIALGASATAHASNYQLQINIQGLTVSEPNSVVNSEQPGAADIELSASFVDFGLVATHTTALRQVVLSNNSALGLGFRAVPLVAGSGFDSDLTTCGSLLSAGQSCLTNVLFSPTTEGYLSGSLSFSTIVEGLTGDVTLTGIAYNPVSLTGTELLMGSTGKQYSAFNFASLLNVSNDASPDFSAVLWESEGAIPDGFTFSEGVLSGTPLVDTPPGGSSFKVTATYKNNKGEQIYILKVGDVTVSAKNITSGEAFTCALTSAGGVKCWGDNIYGQLGDSSGGGSAVPVDVVGLTSGVKLISAGGQYACAVKIDGDMLCWGSNASGEVGDGSTVRRYAPVAVPGVSGVTSIATGFSSTCAVVTGGALKCWGRNNYGQLGIGYASSTVLAPTEVTGLSSGALSVSVGSQHTCAISTGGALQCWGLGEDGQIGDGTASSRLVPRKVQGLSSGVTSVATGLKHTCATLNTGALKCWGFNYYGQLGNGDKVRKVAPVDVIGLQSGVQNVSVGVAYTCATVSNAAKCWGYNYYNQLGDGSYADKITPTTVPGLSSGVSGVSTGLYSACAILTTGAVKCWGTNKSGQVGDGTTTHRGTPVDVLGF